MSEDPSTANDLEASEVSEDRLSDIFDGALTSYNQLQAKRQVSNDAELEPEVKKCMEKFELATRLVSAAGVFSSNETLEDLSTETIKYFLLPALLGHLTMRLITGARREIVRVGEIYFRDFIKRCQEYELTDVKIPLHESEGGKDPTAEAQLYVMMTSRDEKIKRFNLQKELSQKLQVLEKTLKSENVDESAKREYYLTLIKLNVILGIDELNFIKSEMPLIEMAENMELKKREQMKRPPPPPPPLHPYIITKNEAQKAVFGLGYPSMPIYTVEEFYENRVKDGSFPSKASANTSSCSSSQQHAKSSNHDHECDPEAMKDKLVDDDDAVALQKARNMDEFRDDHKRGEGNRHNRS